MVWVIRMNFQTELDKIIASLDGERTGLLLHACCAPCSSYVLEYLSRYFDITLYFYNPNMDSEGEFEKRLGELKRFNAEAGYNLKIEVGEYIPEEFLRIAEGLEGLSEGGERCKKCYRLRLEAAAKKAAAGGFDCFCTTLSISPHKNAYWINEIGGELSGEYGVKFLPSDFKKRGGYQRSIELSREYNLYRQSFCGCAFSKAEAARRSRN